MADRSYERIASRYGAYTSDLSSYRPSNYRPNLSPSSYTPLSRERSVSREPFSSTASKTSTTSYAGRTFGRSASTLTEKDLQETDVAKRYGGFSYLGAGPHKTIAHSTFMDKTRPLASSAFSKYSTVSSRSNASASTENVDSEGTGTGSRYTYRTRPQPLLKKLDIPAADPGPAKPESPAVLSPKGQSPMSSEVSFEKPAAPALEEGIITFINVTTRSTSPSLPSGYIPRTRRFEVSREITKNIKKPPKVPSTESSTQTDPNSPTESTSRFQRYNSSTPWATSYSGGSLTGLNKYVSKFNNPEPSTKSYAPTYSRYDRENSASRSFTSTRSSQALSSDPSKPPLTRPYLNRTKDPSPVRTFQSSVRLGTPSRSTTPPTWRSTVKKSPSPEKISVHASPAPPQNTSKAETPTPTIKRSTLSPSPKPPSRSATPSKKSPSPEKKILTQTSPYVQSKTTEAPASPSQAPPRKNSTASSKQIQRSNSSKSSTPSKKSPSPEKSLTNVTNGRKALVAGTSSEILRSKSSSTSSPTPPRLTTPSPPKKSPSPPKKCPSLPPKKSPSPEKVVIKSVSRSSIENACEPLQRRDSRAKDLSPSVQRSSVDRKSLPKSPSPPKRSSISPEKVPSRRHSFSKSPEKSEIIIRKSASPEKKSHSSAPSSAVDKQKSPPIVALDHSNSASSTVNLVSDILSSSLECPQPTDKKPPVSPSKSEHRLANTIPIKGSKRGIKPSASLNVLMKKKMKDKILSPSESTDFQHVQKRSASEGKLCAPDSNLTSQQLQRTINSLKLPLCKSGGNLALPDPMSLGGSSSDFSVHSLPRVDSMRSNTPGQQRPKSVTQFIRISRSSSKCGSSSDSSAESSEEEDQNDINKNPNVHVVPDRLDAMVKSKSDTKSISRNASGTSDNLSVNLPLDEPPISPQIKTKEAGNKNAASFLMRAFAPVTNLFFARNKEEKSHNNSESDRMDTSQSISELPSDKAENDLEPVPSAQNEGSDCVQAPTQLQVPMRSKSQNVESWLNANEKKTDSRKSVGEESENKKIRPVSSGEKPSWIGSSENLLPPQSPSSEETSEKPSETRIRKVFQSSSGVNTLSWCLDTPEDISESSSEESESESSSEESDEENNKEHSKGPKMNILQRSHVFVAGKNAPELKDLLLVNKSLQELSKASSTSSLSGSKDNFSSSKHQSLILQDSSWWKQWNSDIPEDAVLMLTDERDHSPQNPDGQPIQCSLKVQWVRDKDTLSAPLQQSTSAKSVTSEWARKYKMKRARRSEKVRRNNSEIVLSKRAQKSQKGAGDEELALIEKSACSRSAGNLLLLQQSGSAASMLRSSENGDSHSEPRYKIHHAASGEKAWWTMSTDNVPAGTARTESITLNLKRADSKNSHRPASAAMSDAGSLKRSASARLKSIKRIESGERAWWLDDNCESVPEGILRLPSDKSLGPRTENDGASSRTGSLKRSASSKLKSIKRIESGERAWWLDDDEDNVPEGVTRLPRSRDDSPERLDTQESNEELLVPSRAGSLKRSASAKLKSLKRCESGERPWWLSDNDEAVPEGITRLPSDKHLDVLSNEGSIARSASGSVKRSPSTRLKTLTRIESGERAWWMEDDEEKVPDGVSRLPPDKPEAAEAPKWPTEKNGAEAADESTSSESDEESEEEDVDLVDELMKSELGHRTSPDGVEEPSLANRWQNIYDSDDEDWLGAKIFICDTTNIDDLLGDEKQPEQVSAEPEVKEAQAATEEGKRVEEKTKSSSEEESSEESDAEGQKSKDSDSISLEEKLCDQPAATEDDNKAEQPAEPEKLDDAALQILKDGEFGAYLDLDASISEQQEEFDGLKLSRKNSIVLRTQLSVRVHAIIEKLQNSEGRDLQRALFSLKQIFQEDKDLVHEFVQNDGLACLVKVGSEADQNYQNYILRALGQVMLYVDGMNGVMEHTDTVQWLYSLIASKFRLVVKTSLKLLLVFIEYKESNCDILINAIRAEDIPAGERPWHNVMRLLGGYDTSDTELLLYACTLLNKTLNGLTNRHTYYDQVDIIEAQGMSELVQKYMNRQGTDLDLLRQFQIYEAVLKFEDGEEDADGSSIIMIDETLRKTLRHRKICSVDSPTTRRRSKRWLNNYNNNLRNASPQLIVTSMRDEDDDDSSSSRSSPSLGNLEFIVSSGNYDHNDITPGLRKRRERAERHRSLREQQETILRSLNKEDEERKSGGEQDVDNQLNNVSRSHSRQDVIMNAVNHLESGLSRDSSGVHLSRENTVKDLTQKLSGQIGGVSSPTDEQKLGRIGDMTGLISKAMEGLNKSKSDSKTETKIAPPEPPKKSEVDLQWEKITENVDRPLALCDLDFTDLNSEDEVDILAPSIHSNGVPPPPPPAPAMMPPGAMPPPPCAPPSFGSAANSAEPGDNNLSEKLAKKSKKTVKLFWKEVRDDPVVVARLQKSGISLIWDELSPVFVDTQKLEHLFESRAKDIAPKEKQQDLNKSKELIVLDSKRSNAINIGMTKLPPPRVIKTAILKMDTSVINREGIEKLFTMLPTEDERNRIQEAQVAHPDIPLGNAEQFLLTLTSITELSARLKLWAFKLDYENIEKEIAEPVMDLKQGMETLKSNRTFRCILGTLLSIGIFLNGVEVRGFQIEYLAKVPEVKDTVHKHSLLHHLCHMVMEKFPDATDLYSEIGAITRVSKVDFDEIKQNIKRLESECKASWEHLKVIAKHDGTTTMKSKMSDFLTDCAQRIIVLKTVHRRIMNRYSKFLLWLGTPAMKINETKPNEFCRILSEFALEYRTTRERVIQQMEKKANHRERNKTRGRMITEVSPTKNEEMGEMGKFRAKEVCKKDDQLRQLLGGDITDSESTWRRQRRDFDRNHSEVVQSKDERFSDDDEILNSLVKTATKSRANRANPRERKRFMQADRKSALLNRSRSTTRGEYRPPL
ncbi:uncharacterized protein Fhos isoform X3 [Cloeon dipterum]|uniref:uncharacterized protein Fhos isoform X3 n=1 Tax=Cloeon dipterum TaxID=197152 RepID=UPI00321FA0A7